MAKKKPKQKRGKKMLFPENAEKSYARALRKMLFGIKGQINTILFPYLKFILDESQEDYSRDIWANILDAAIEKIRIESISYMMSAANEIKLVGLQISRYNEKQLQKSLNPLLGVDQFLNQPFLKTQLESFSEQSTALISTLSVDEIQDVKGVVLRAVSNGDRFTETAKNIQKRFEISSRHAKMIARDQTAKLNSSLARLRQESVGVTEFIWQTSGDDRVRKSHKVLDGMVCSWKDTTVYKIPGETDWRKKSSIGGTEDQVGQDYQCRCVSIPIIDIS